MSEPRILRIGDTFYVPEPLHPDFHAGAVEVVPASRLQEAACSHRTIAEWSALEARLQEATEALRDLTAGCLRLAKHDEGEILYTAVRRARTALAALDSLGEAPE